MLLNISRQLLESFRQAHTRGTGNTWLIPYVSQLTTTGGNLKSNAYLQPPTFYVANVAQLRSVKIFAEMISRTIPNSQNSRRPANYKCFKYYLSPRLN